MFGSCPRAFDNIFSVMHYRGHLLRRHVSSLLLSLFLLGGVAAPLVDGWLHLQDQSSASLADSRHDCALCRLVVTPALPGADPIRLLSAPETAGETGSVSQDSAPRRNHHRLLPSRGPPA